MSGFDTRGSEEVERTLNFTDDDLSYTSTDRIDKGLSVLFHAFGFESLCFVVADIEVLLDLYSEK